MSWQRVLENDPGSAVPLRQRIELLFAQQRDTWPAMREGEAALQHLQRKSLTLDGRSIVVQANPSRRRSTLAMTDSQSVAARPCFLCPQNMPPEERGVSFEDLVVLPNPFPVLPLHCTIAAVEHQPQRVAGRVGLFLQLARSIGPDLLALYNGPRCGASAPDHFHFQAVAVDEIPLINELAALSGDCRIRSHYSFGRSMLVFTGFDSSSMEADIDRSIRAFRELDGSRDEPMFNLMAHFRPSGFTVALFPRTAHRPACFFNDGANRLAISPAVLEMCGVFVTSEASDFPKVVAEAAKGIYHEVSVPVAVVDQVAAGVALPSAKSH